MSLARQLRVLRVGMGLSHHSFRVGAVQPAPKHRVVYGGVQFAEVAVSPGGFGAPPVPHDGVEIAVGSVVIRLPKSTAAARIVDIAQRLASRQ